MYITWKMKLASAFKAGIIPLVVLVSLSLIVLFYNDSQVFLILLGLSSCAFCLSLYYGFDRQPLRYKINDIDVIFKNREAYVDKFVLEREVKKWLRFWKYNPNTRVTDPWRVFKGYKIVYSNQVSDVDEVNKVIYIHNDKSRSWYDLQYLLGQVLVEAEGVQGLSLQHKWREQRGLMRIKE